MKRFNPITQRQQKVAAYARGKILDIGYADHPNPYLKGLVTGIDLVKSPAPKNYQQTIVGDALKISKIFRRHQFDTVVAAEVIEHLENPAQFLRETNYVLKDNGQVIIVASNPYYPPTFMANILFLRPEHTAHISHDPYHLHLLPYRNFVTLVEHCLFKLIKVVKCNGLVLNFETGPVLPLPKAICQSLVYILEKELK